MGVHGHQSVRSQLLGAPPRTPTPRTGIRWISIAPLSAQPLPGSGILQYCQGQIH